MSSLTKKVSMTQLYSDLQKYQSNLHSAKQSRLKKDFSASSLHKSSSKTATYKNSNLGKFQKIKFSGNPKPRLERGNPGKLKIQQKQIHKKNYDFEEPHRFSRIESNKNSFISSYPIDNKEKQNDVFSKKDEILFLKECQNLYGTKELGRQKDSVKVLLKQINKRDQVYETMTEKFGCDSKEKVECMFKEYDLMKGIIDQFKFMSKLSIDNYQELYAFLKSQTDREDEDQVTYQYN